jgi:HNH endonuclease
VARPDRELLEAIVRRAQGRCEYCQFPESAAELPFHADHIIAEKHGGPTEAANLAWACFSCNLRKGPNIAGFDPATGELTRLFHPRKDVWAGHFEWQGARLRGKTAIGRTTIAVLDINHADAVTMREALFEEGHAQ